MKLETGEVVAARRRSVVAATKEAGVLAGGHTTVRAKVPRELVTRAKERSGISATTALIEYALAKLAIEDEFGSKLVARKGSIPIGVKLGV